MQRGYIIAAIGLVLLGMALSRLLNGGSTASGPPATPTPPPLVYQPLPGPPADVVGTFGAGAGLTTPRDAVALPGGRVAVVDTDNGRLVVLKASGDPVRTVRRGEGGLKAPFAVALTNDGLLAVLDADNSTIELFDQNGHLVRTLIHSDQALHFARGMTIGADGRYYVANPLSNSIVIISPQGTVLNQIHTTNGKAPGQFDQVSAIAVGPGGTMYVLDNQNYRIEEFSPSGAYVAQWPAPASSTLMSVNMLVLSDGRLLASDPAGALLLYPPGSPQPTRMQLQMNGTLLAQVQPLGLALMKGNRVLVADGKGNRVLEVTLPRALG